MNTSLKKIIDYCKGSNLVYVYGTGNYGRTVMSFLKEHDIRIAGFVESDEMLKEKRIMGECVKALSHISKDSRLLVSVGSGSRGQIEENLRNVDFKDYLVLSSEMIFDISNMVEYQPPVSDKKMINVLVYHRVVKNIEFDTWNLSVDVNNFEKHIKYIKENYQVLRLEDDWYNVTENSVVITFDDGYADNYWNALPVLEKYQVPATIFVSTQNLGTDKVFFWDYIENCIMRKDYSSPIVFGGDSIDSCESPKMIINRIRDVMKKAEPQKREKLMYEFISSNPHLSKIKDELAIYRSLTIDELKELSASKYITIGAHGVTHSSLAHESIDVQEREISESKKILEDITGKDVSLFSYPYGGKLDYTRETISLLKEKGFKKAVVNWRGIVNKSTDLFQIPRTKIYNGSEKICAREIHGSYCMYGDYSEAN